MEKKLKIAMLVANFPPYFGGIGNACYHNALELARLGHNVTVFTRSYKQHFPYPKEIKVRQLGSAFSFGNATLLPGLLKIKDFDVIHLHLPFHFGAELALVVSKLRGIPLVVSYQMDLVGEGWKKHFFKAHEKTFLKAVLKSAKKIIVSSEDYAANSNFSKLFAQRGRDVVAIPNGVDTKQFMPHKKNIELLKKLGLKKNDKIILFVGALDKAHYFKGVDFLLKAFAKIDDKKAKLLVVGEGDLKQKYINEAKELGISNRTVFAGWVSETDLPDYYALCDFLVLPSTDKGEAFGIVLVEAMASSKPVIAGNLPGIRSVVDNAKNGLLFEAGNEKDLVEKMNYLLDNNALSKKMGALGRKKALKEFDWKKIAKRIEKVYEPVID